MKYFNILTVLLGVCEALPESRRFPNPNAAALERRQKSLDPNLKAGVFEQLIDHFPNSTRYTPHTGDKTFNQRYYYDATYYKPGGPVILYIGGEVSILERVEFIQRGIVKYLMEATNGLGVLLENRYYGHSYPFEGSTTDELRFLTFEQSAADKAYFAQHATFPDVQGNESLRSPNSPWITYGGSLAGAESAVVLHEYGGDGGVIWAGIAASGTTHAQLEYPQWYAPIQKFGPQDCIASINAIVEKINYVFGTGNATLIHQMKAVFGLESLTDGDFAQTIAFPIGGPFDYPTYTWQELNWDLDWFPDDGSQDFWYFCANVTNLNAPAEITEVDYSLPEPNGERWVNLGSYANYIKKQVIPLCGGALINSSDCFSTQNQTFWAHYANSGTRSYLYTTCTEYGLYQVAPKSGPSLIANSLDVAYTQQWCTWAFPPGKYNSIPASPELWRVGKYGGYNVSQDRLAHIDGEQDVWLDICYHSNDAPLRYSTSPQEENMHPQLLISGSGHHWDSYGLGGLKNLSMEPQFIRNAHLWEIRTVEKWVREWQASH